MVLQCFWRHCPVWHLWLQPIFAITLSPSILFVLWNATKLFNCARVKNHILQHYLKPNFRPHSLIIYLNRFIFIHPVCSVSYHIKSNYIFLYRFLFQFFFYVLFASCVNMQIILKLCMLHKIQPNLSIFYTKKIVICCVKANIYLIQYS